MEVDFYGDATEYNAAVFDTGELCRGLHGIAVRVTGRKNPSSSGYYISLDRVAVVP
jgi:hypothetical protein